MWSVCLAWLLLLVGEASLRSQDADPAGGLELPPLTYPDIVARMEAGRAAEALAAFESAAGEPEGMPLEGAILRATLLARAGRPAEAEAEWRTVAGRAVFMRTFARRAIVESLVARGAPAAAEPVLDELTRTDAARHRDLVLGVADAHLAAGNASRAAALYRRVLAGTASGAAADTARLGLAAALEAAGDVDAALATLRAAQLRHRTAAAFVAARREAQRLWRTRGGEPPSFAEAEYRTLVRRLRNASRFAPAIALLDDWSATFPGRASQERIAAERIATLYAERDNAAAVAACRQFYDRFPDSPLASGIRLTDFRLAVRMRDRERARRLGLDLWEGRVAGASGAERRGAGVLLAASLVAGGDTAGGLSLYRGLFRTAPSPDEQRATLWRAGVAAVRAGEHERALVNLRALLDRRPDGDLALAGRYWLGVAHARAGDPAAAARSFEALAAGFPYHYYGLTARRRLAEMGRAAPGGGGGGGEPRLDFPELALGTAAQGRAEFKAAMALARAGLIGDAAWYLRRLLDRRRGDRALALLAARASSRAGDHASAARVLFSHFAAYFNQPARGLPHDFLTLAYPRPFWDTVVDAARMHRADPVLLVSLMRRESRFDPAARSAVGAVGLLQIMPYTAEALAERAGVGDILQPDGIDDATLADPRVNIAIAARLNADLLEMFDGARLPVIASYNAGEDHAGDWWNAARELRDDFFIDGIPYTETRNFAREVVANYAAYERIYGAR